MHRFNTSSIEQCSCSRRDFIGAAALSGIAGAAGSVIGGLAKSPQAAWADEASSTATPPKAAGLQPYAQPYVNETQQRMDETKRLLVVVDYQVDFVDGGVFGRIEPATAIEDALADRVQEYLDRGDIIIYTMDTHPSDNYAETREGQVNPPHCIPGQPGWELYGKVGKLLSPDNAICVKKGTYGSRDLPFVVQTIREQGVNLEYIEMAGVSTTCRVLHNAIILFNFFPELPFIFDERTTASYSDEATQEQLDELEAWGFIVRRK